MSSPQCRFLTTETMHLMADEAFAQKMRELTSKPHTAEDVVDLLCSYHDPIVAEEMRAEYLAMPRPLAFLLVESWRLAAEAGKPWTFTSLSPESPLQYARQKKVRFVIDVDEEGVTLGVAHVHGRKAPWYQPNATAIAEA